MTRPRHVSASNETAKGDVAPAGRPDCPAPFASAAWRSGMGLRPRRTASAPEGRARSGRSDLAFGAPDAGGGADARATRSRS
jgi:hypothetical protein